MNIRRILLATAAAVLVATGLPGALAAQQQPRERERPRDSVRVRVAPLARALELSSTVARRAVIGVTLAGGSEADTAGVRIEEVTEGGPADRAGLRAGDRIVAVNGQDIRLTRSEAADEAQRSLATRRISRAIGELSPGDEVTLRVRRDGNERDVRLNVVSGAELARARFSGDSASGRWLMVGRNDRPVLGMSLQASGTARDTLGAFVASVAPDGPAERAGIYEGDRIESINGVDLRVRPVDAGDRYVAQLKAGAIDRAMENANVGEPVEVRVWRSGQVRTVRVTPVPASEVQGGGWQMFRAPAAPASVRMWSPEAMTFPRMEGMVSPRGEFRIRSDSGVRVFRFDGDGEREVIIEIDPEMRGQIEAQMREAMQHMRQALEEARRSSTSMDATRRSIQVNRAELERARNAMQLRSSELQRAREAMDRQRTELQRAREAIMRQQRLSWI